MRRRHKTFCRAFLRNATVICRPLPARGGLLIFCEPFSTSATICLCCSLGKPTHYAVQKQGPAPKICGAPGQGEDQPETYEEWNRETGGKQLPEHVRHKRKKTGKRRKRR